MKCLLWVLIKLIITQAIIDLKNNLPIIGSLSLHDWKPIRRIFHFGMAKLQSNNDFIVTST